MPIRRMLCRQPRGSTICRIWPSRRSMLVSTTFVMRLCVFVAVNRKVSILRLGMCGVCRHLQADCYGSFEDDGRKQA